MKRAGLGIVAFAAGFLSARIFEKKDGRQRDEKEKELQDKAEKMELYYHMLNMWLEMRQKGKSGVTFLQKKGIKRIAIYGMKELGERLYEEVKSVEIEVVCVIDKNPDQVLGDFLVISPEDALPEVDAIIVTADYYYWEIKSQLEKKAGCPVYSLNGVLGNSFRRNL